MGSFSLSEDVLKDILIHAKPLGHHEKPRNLNLGFGFLYYGVVRALRPQHTLVIGSGYGFSVICLGLAVKDNGQGSLTFVDPSYSLLRDGPMKTFGGRGTWGDERAVQDRFKRFGVEDVVTHFKVRSEELFQSYGQLGLPPIDLAFIDGSHSFGDVKRDFNNVVERSHKNTYVFLHDTNIYIREFLRHAGVKRWVKWLKQRDEAYEVIDFPFSSGVALVRVLEPSVCKQSQAYRQPCSLSSSS
ncbi:MAG: class I SAM-dependent methyltransferase [Desulfomonilaceae bacterium]|nr:class I SAM-dependent methyltransferase [Desulfomonilaceae bacterium]